jgi:transposase InsO family protein
VAAFRFIEAEKANHTIRTMCRVLRVSRAGYYDGKARPAAETGDRALVVHIRSIHRESHGTYGSPRVARALRGRGMLVNRKRVAQIMRQEGLQGLPRRRFRGSTTRTDPAHPVAENLLQREFSTDAPNEAWVADITYLPTLTGWAYLAVLIDLFSRKVVGWAIDDVIDTRLCLRALERAVAARSPAAGLIHHSDRGCQYTSHAYQAALKAHGAVPSMSRKGNCWDNAVAESFFGTLKQEVPFEDPRLSVDDLRAAIGTYIHGFYNTTRLHSSNDYRAPVDHERHFLETAADPVT